MTRNAHEKIQDDLQGILNVLKQPEWGADLSVAQLDGLQSIREKTNAAMLTMTNCENIVNAIRSVEDQISMLDYYRREQWNLELVHTKHVNWSHTILGCFLLLLVAQTVVLVALFQTWNGRFASIGKHLQPPPSMQAKTGELEYFYTATDDLP